MGETCCKENSTNHQNEIDGNLLFKNKANEHTEDKLFSKMNTTNRSGGKYKDRETKSEIERFYKDKEGDHVFINKATYGAKRIQSSTRRRLQASIPLNHGPLPEFGEFQTSLPKDYRERWYDYQSSYEDCKIAENLENM